MAQLDEAPREVSLGLAIALCAEQRCSALPRMVRSATARPARPVTPASTGALAEATTCDDDNPCTTDGCDPNGGCVHTFHQKPCDDGRLYGVRPLLPGVCVGEAIEEDGNPCTIDTCDEVAG